MFDNGVFHANVAIESVLGAVEAFTIGIGTGKSLDDIFVAPPL